MSSITSSSTSFFSTKNAFVLWLFCLFLTTQLSIAQSFSKDIFFENLLCADTHKVVKKVIQNPSAYRLQLLYTPVTKDAWNRLDLPTYSYRNTPTTYFYPASLVKLPVCMLMAEWMYTNRFPLSSYLFTQAKTWCKPAGTFTKTDTLRVSDYINKSLIYSDNPSFNELYDALGIPYINEQLQAKKYSSAKIFQRLDNCDYNRNRSHGNVILTDSAFNLRYQRTEIQSDVPYKNEDAMVGTQCYVNGKYIPLGKNFVHCNAISLEDMHQLLQDLILMQLHSQPKFCMDDRSQTLLLDALSTTPESYDSLKFPSKTKQPRMDFKYWLYGGKYESTYDSLLIFNKVGLSYGFMMDVAFIYHPKKRVGFFLSGVIFANEDGIMNDGLYEYSSVGFPFFKRVGQLIMEQYFSEKRPYTFSPYSSYFEGKKRQSPLSTGTK